MLGPTKKGFQPINIPYYLWSKTGIIKAFYWPISYPQRVIGLKPDKNVQKTLFPQGSDFNRKCFASLSIPNQPTVGSLAVSFFVAGLSLLAGARGKTATPPAQSCQPKLPAISCKLCHIQIAALRPILKIQRRAKLQNEAKSMEMSKMIFIYFSYLHFLHK